MTTPWDYGLDGYWIDEDLGDSYRGLPVANGAPAEIHLSNGLVLTQFNGTRYKDESGAFWDLTVWDYPDYYTFVIGTPREYSRVALHLFSAPNSSGTDNVGVYIPETALTSGYVTTVVVGTYFGDDERYHYMVYAKSSNSETFEYRYEGIGNISFDSVSQPVLTVSVYISGVRILVNNSTEVMLGFTDTSQSATVAAINIRPDIEGRVDSEKDFAYSYLAKSYASSNRVDKTSYIEEVAKIEGTFRTDVSVVNPTIRLELEDLEFNYVYLDSLKRYYFVTGMDYIGKNLWDVHLHCDVLMTYKDAIKDCTAFVDRNENIYNELIVDDKIPLQQGQTVTTTFIDNDVYTDGTGQFVLTGLLVSTGDSASATSLELGVGSEVIDENSEVTQEQTGESEVETDEQSVLADE